MAKRNTAGVSWYDVWAWCGEVRDSYGYWATFQVAPPLPSQARRSHGTLTLTLTKYLEGGLTSVLRSYVGLPHPERGRVEDVALQLIAAAEKQLDREAWESERAGLPPEQALLF